MTNAVIKGCGYFDHLGFFNLNLNQAYGPSVFHFHRNVAGVVKIVFCDLQVSI